MPKRKRPAASNGSGPATAVQFAAPRQQPTKKARPASSTAPTDAADGAADDDKAADGDEEVVIQIVTGSYDRALHGMTATIGGAADLDGKTPAAGVKSADRVEFADSFLFNAHTSAIRCLALSPPSAAPSSSSSSSSTTHAQQVQPQKLFLASGGSDERVNVYALSAHPPSLSRRRRDRALSTAGGRPVAENARNREVGALMHHAGAVTRLAFPTRAKLLSASEDCTVGVTRTRDWTLLSSVKAPLPKVKGRPSGDTAAAGEGGNRPAAGGPPSGVADFAVHGSLKLMITVGRGESCMRLWNLVTGKKAGVLEFERGLLADYTVAGGEEDADGKATAPRRAAGGVVAATEREGRRVAWGLGDAQDGEEFAVAFERDVVVFGMDSTPRCRVMPPPARPGRRGEKIHEISYVGLGGGGGAADEDEPPGAELLAVSTEDGKVMFFSTRSADLIHHHVPEPEEGEGGVGREAAAEEETSTTTETATATAAAAAASDKAKPHKRRRAAAHNPAPLPRALPVAQLGGRDVGVQGRVKDFRVLKAGGGGVLYVVTAASDGCVRLWRLRPDELQVEEAQRRQVVGGKESGAPPRQVGTLLGVCETQNRITCLEAFVMIPRPEGMVDEDEDEDEDEDDDDEEEDDLDEEDYDLETSEEDP